MSGTALAQSGAAAEPASSSDAVSGNTSSAAVSSNASQAAAGGETSNTAVSGDAPSAAVAAPPVVNIAAAPPDDFQRGLDALAAKQYAEAVTAFKAAYEHDQNTTALLNLGIAYTNLGRPQDAVQSLQSYLDHADPQRDAQSMDAVRAEIARLRSVNGDVRLHATPDTALVQIDGEPVTLVDGQVLLTPGKRHVSAVADGYQPYQQDIDVPAGQFTLEIKLKPVAQVAAVPPTPKAPQPPAHGPTDEPERSAASSCALSQMCIGPVVALLGPPNLIGGGLHMRFGRYLGAGIDYQVLPTLNFNPISIGTTLISANARVYPFGGAFFLGGGIGYQTINGTYRDGDIGVAAHAGFPAAMASIGFMGHDGFVLGADLGLLFPLGSTRVTVQDASNGGLAARGVPQADIDAAMSQAQDQMSKVLNALPVLLQLNLIRLGYLF